MAGGLLMGPAGTGDGKLLCIVTVEEVDAAHTGIQRGWNGALDHEAALRIVGTLLRIDGEENRL